MGWNDAVIEQFLEGRARIVDTFDRENLVLLDTTGARTGQRRTSPVACLPDGDRLLVIASKAGADTHPAWFHNLVANPTVHVRRWEGDALAEYDAEAEVLEGDERARAWERVVTWSPGFAEYQTKTDRVIPVVALTPKR
ncbi:MAG: nitroreductase family deazaflavin-dependent oxidoreductase [Actinobacteria bacterium]|nr:nitroreductase family deazaflavin-dependent oxidoreductase [Actinomycetota bacterium]